MPIDKAVSVTFARGGSKGLPRKNLLPINGIPLLGHAIACAKEVLNEERIFVSTEDQEIAECAKSFGARVISRPVELAQDISPEWDSWRHACLTLEKLDIDFDCLVSVPCTSPLRNSDDIVNCIKTLDAHSNGEACISVSESFRSPYFNMVETKENGFCKVVIENDFTVSRRQDVPTVFDITTVAYAARKNFILHSNNIFEGNVCFNKVPKERSIDIDDAYDFMIAKMLLERTV